jgi:hypothetical protein
MTDDAKPTLSVTITVPLSRICDMVIGAMEGGSAYWCNEFFPVSLPPALPEKPWYANPAVYADPTTRISVHYDKTTDGDPGVKMLEAKDFALGLQVFAAKYPRHLADLLDENDDATTADIFLQCVVLGDVVYG